MFAILLVPKLLWLLWQLFLFYPLWYCMLMSTVPFILFSCWVTNISLVLVFWCILSLISVFVPGKLIIIANNCPPLRKSEIEYYAMLAKVTVHHFHGSKFIVAVLLILSCKYPLGYCAYLWHVVLLFSRQCWSWHCLRQVLPCVLPQYHWPRFVS